MNITYFLCPSIVFHVFNDDTMKLMFSHYDPWKSCFLIVALNETFIYPQFYPKFSGFIFVLSWRPSLFLIFMQSFRVLDIFCRPFNNIFSTFLLLSCWHAQNFSGAWLLKFSRLLENKCSCDVFMRIREASWLILKQEILCWALLKTILSCVFSVQIICSIDLKTLFP